ncbi:MAG: septum formation protein Maf [Clostridia bacterium]|nr:septum formation protein Maf [Clostridia bacterium]
MKLILGSKSPRRREILSMVTENFEVRVSNCDESYEENTPLCEVPKILAERKARAILQGSEEIVIGCDTVVVYENELMGKPCDKADAVRMLKKLSGTTHEVISGICVCQGGKSYSEAVTTYVTFRCLTDKEINAYVERYNPVDKAGAYGIQEMAGAFVEKIDGDFYNVVGLPLCRLCEILKNEFSVELI